MPIYEYLCSHCQHSFELLQKVNDDPIKECPQCQHLSVEKLISAAGFRLKGGGWYETDFKTDSDKKKNLTGAPETNQSSTGSTEGSEKSPVVSEKPAATETKPATAAAANNTSASSTD